MKNKRYSRVYVEITNICNKNCSFCPGTTRKKGRMTFDEFKHIANSLLPLTDYVYFHVMGEPLTHPELPEFIKYATSLGLKCAVTTNGSLVEQRADELISSGIYKVNLSVHSFEEGSEESQREYIEMLCRFANKSSENGVLTVLRLWNSGCDGGKNDKTLEILKENLDGEWKWGTRGARIRHKLHLEYGDRFKWPDINAELGGECLFCYGLRDHFGILCDGSVIPCCLDNNGEITLGNVFETPIQDILNSQRATAILEGFDKRIAVEELCRKCGYAHRFD